MVNYDSNSPGARMGFMLILTNANTWWHYVGWTEYGHWAQERSLWRSESKSLSEPKVNYITNANSEGKRRYIIRNLEPPLPYNDMVNSRCLG